MGQRCKCLIVDDHPIFRKGVRDLLVEESVCTSVVESGSTAEALSLVRREPWDLVLLDIALPDRHGLEALKSIKRLRPSLPVLVLSLYPEREFALRALKGGASGYLTKDRPPDELLKAVTEAIAGRRYVTASFADQLADAVSGGQPEQLHDALSDRELEVLRLLGQGKGMSVIARDLSLSVKTVSTYRSRLLGKLHLATTGQLVRYAIEHGLIA